MIKQAVNEGWRIVPGTMYITSVELQVPLPAGQSIRRINVIAFAMMEKE